MKYLLVLVISMAIVFGALCPNVCSGHGTCTKAGTCTCNPTYTGGTCPYGRPYVDPSFVDENVNPNDHNYMECSGQGECDRTNGLCVCHKGYEGSNCGRLSCPNGCSGHGVCTATRYLENEGTQYYQREATTDYSYWDKEQSHVCYCDEEYTGYDCSMKKCAYGYMATSDCDELEGGNTQTFTITTGNTADEIYLAYLKYTDPFGRVWFSDYFDVTHATSTEFNDGKTDNTKVVYATIPGWTNVVNSFPPGVMNVEKVVVYKDGKVEDASNMDGIKGDGSDKSFKSTTVLVQITYGSHQTGRQGENLQIITVGDITEAQSSDLSYHGLSSSPDKLVTTSFPQSFTPSPALVNLADKSKITEFKNPDLPSPTPCAQNGLCNPSTGLCECFKGFYGLACTEQLELL